MPATFIACSDELMKIAQEQLTPEQQKALFREKLKNLGVKALGAGAGMAAGTAAYYGLLKPAMSGHRSGRAVMKWLGPATTALTGLVGTGVAMKLLRAAEQDAVEASHRKVLGKA